MPTLSEFHKPTDLPAALALLKRQSPRTVPLAGGTWLNPRIGQEVAAEAVVDLGGLGLDQIERAGDTLRLGAMATLADVADNSDCRSLAGGILAQAARRDAPINVRNAATVGGTVIVAPLDSEFVLALLALGAKLDVQSDKVTAWALGQFLANPTAALDGGLLTHVRISLPAKAASGSARVGRTLADRPIVAAVAVVAQGPNTVRIALGGSSPRPLLVEADPSHPLTLKAVAQVIASAEPYEDWKGTATYRREMGVLVAKRALEQALANFDKPGVSK